MVGKVGLAEYFKILYLHVSTAHNPVSSTRGAQAVPMVELEVHSVSLDLYGHMGSVTTGYSLTVMLKVDFWVL